MDRDEDLKRHLAEFLRPNPVTYIERMLTQPGDRRDNYDAEVRKPWRDQPDWEEGPRFSKVKRIRQQVESTWLASTSSAATQTGNQTQQPQLPSGMWTGLPLPGSSVFKGDDALDTVLQFQEEWFVPSRLAMERNVSPEEIGFSPAAREFLRAFDLPNLPELKYLRPVFAEQGIELQAGEYWLSARLEDGFKVYCWICEQQSNLYIRTLLGLSFAQSGALPTDKNNSSAISFCKTELFGFLASIAEIYQSFE